MQDFANTEIEICCGNLFSELPQPILRPMAERKSSESRRRKMTMDQDKEDVNSEVYGENIRTAPAKVPGWIKIGAIAAASVLAGGLAATWFYRKTLSRLHQADQVPQDSNSGRNDEGTDDETWQI